MLAAVRAEKMPFLSLVTLTFDLDLQNRLSEGRLSCEFGANPFRGSRDISYTNKKVTDSTKNNLTQFTACNNHCLAGLKCQRCSNVISYTVC